MPLRWEFSLVRSLFVQTGEVVEHASASQDDLVEQASDLQKLNQLALGLVPQTVGLSNMVCIPQTVERARTLNLVLVVLVSLIALDAVVRMLNG